MSASLIWQDGVPVARRFDDPYYSLQDGLAETRHVFLAGNGLPDRFAPGFHIAELGFGTGLNLLATFALWRATSAQGPLRFTSFEAFPLSRDDMALALARFPALSKEAAQLTALWSPEGGAFELAEGFEVDVVIGDARAELAGWQGQADAWFLDGFSPAKNPELWGADLMREVAKHTAPGGTFATYTAAGHVRRALAEAGFEVARVPGFGRKRHMSTGTLAKPA